MNRRLLICTCLLYALTSIQCTPATGRQSLLSVAGWITHTVDEKYDREKQYFFSKQFNIGDAKVVRAVVQVTAEGNRGMTLYVNGRIVGESKQWHDLAEFNIQPFLRPGENKISATVLPSEWAAAMFCAGRVELADGRAIDVISDDSWDTWWTDEPEPKKAEILVRGVDGGFWNNVTPMKMPPQFTELNTGYELPHIPWAKPFAGEPLTVLALQSRWEQDHTVALYHRLGAKFTTVLSDPPPQRNPRLPFHRNIEGGGKQDVIDNIAAAITRSYDVIIMAGAGEDVFDAEAQAWLKKAVSDGAGLIIAGGLPGEGLVEQLTATQVTQIPKFMTTGLPYASLEGMTPAEGDQFPANVTLYRFGRGRVVKLGFNMSTIPVSAEKETAYEYHQSFLIKSILWAAGREPAVLFTQFPLELTDSTPSPFFGSLHCRLTSPRAAGRYDVTLGICSSNALLDVPAQPYAGAGVHQGNVRVLPVREQTLHIAVGADTPIEFRLPKLPAGTYFLNVRVSQNGKQVNWATAMLTVDAAIRVEQVTVDPPWLDMKAEKVLPIKATIALSELPKQLASGTGPLSLDVSVIDNYNRVLDRASVAVDQSRQTIELTLSVPHIMTVLGKVRAELRAGTQPVDIGVGRFTTTTRRDWDKFVWSGWGAGNRYYAGLGQTSTKGFNRAGSLDALEFIDAPADPGGGGARIGAVDVDPVVLANKKKAVQAHVRKLLPFDPLCYSSADEVRYGGGEDLPARVAEFRRQLQAQYKSIDALNEQWDSGYSSFDEVPAIVGQTLSALTDKGQVTGNFSPVVDQHLENFRAYTEHWRFWVDAINEVDPGARMGTESPLWPWAGSCFDWYELSRMMGFFSPYGREGDLQTYEYASSWSRPGSLLAMTYGGYWYNGFVRKAQPNDPEFHRWRPWSALLRGYNGVWFYLMGPYWESVNGPGGEAYPALLAAADTIATIRNGNHTLFRRSKREHDGIAIHYSVPSNIITEHLSDFNHLPWDVHSLIRILQDYAPRRYEFVASQQIVKGELDHYRVLILPLSQAISAEESVELDRFVRRGGLLIADVRPGVCDKHGKVGGNRVVPELFGITYDRTLGRRNVTGEVRGRYKGQAFASDAGRFPVDPSLRLSGAVAAAQIDGVPLMTYNQVGKGTAVCINSPFNWYKNYPTPDSLYYYLGRESHNKRMGQLLSTILAAHNIQRIANVEPIDGEWPWGLELRYSTDGEAQYVGLTKRRGEHVEPDRKLRVTVPRQGHVYDMFSGRYHGRTNSWHVTMPATGVQLYGLLPYKVDGVEVTLKDDTVNAGSMIQGRVVVATSGGHAVRHVINLRVKRPDGKMIRYLSKNLETTDGAVSFVIPLALNDPQGTYVLIFTDVVSQTDVAVNVNLR